MTLISKPDCLASAELIHPVIELQLSGDPLFDQLKKSLLQSRGTSSSSGGAGVWRYARYVPGFGALAAQNTEDVLQNDVQFLNSFHSAGSKPHEQWRVNEIKRAAASTLDSKAKRTIDTFISLLKSKLKVITRAELEHMIAQSVQSKKRDVWSALRAELVEELNGLNAIPGIP